MVDWKSKYLAMKLKYINLSFLKKSLDQKNLGVSPFSKGAKYINTKQKGGIKLCNNCNEIPTGGREYDLCNKCNTLKELKNKLSPNPNKKLFVYLNHSPLGLRGENPKSLIDLEEFTEKLYKQYFYDEIEHEDDGDEYLEVFNSEYDEIIKTDIENWKEPTELNVIDWFSLDSNNINELINTPNEFFPESMEKSYKIGDDIYQFSLKEIDMPYGTLKLIYPINHIKNNVSKRIKIKLDDGDRILWDWNWDKIILIEAESKLEAESILAKYNRRFVEKYESIYGAGVWKVYNPFSNTEDEET